MADANDEDEDNLDDVSDEELAAGIKRISEAIEDARGRLTLLSVAERVQEITADLNELSERVDALQQEYQERLEDLPAFVGELRQRLEEVEDDVVERVNSLEDDAESIRRNESPDRIDARLTKLEASATSSNSGCLSLVVFAIFLKVFWPWITAVFAWLWDVAVMALAFVVAALQQK